MEPSSQLQSTAGPALVSRLARAAGELDAPSKFALLCIFLGWFMVDTFVVTLGSLQHGVRFFDISAVIADPTRLFFGVQGFSHRIMFGLFCILCLLAPLLPHVRGGRAAWLSYTAPLLLMVTCAALLYWRTSSDLFAAPANAGAAAGSLIKFANSLVQRGSDMVSRHVSIGVGGYLALIACIVLALRGIRRFRNPPPSGAIT
jgi:hypothetical protein